MDTVRSVPYIDPQMLKKIAGGDAIEQPLEPVTPTLFDLPETGFRVSEEGDAKPLHEIMQEAEADEIAAQALRDCLK